MDSIAWQETGIAMPPQDGILSKRALKLQQWESHRDEIYQSYVVQNHTLQMTMKIMKENHDFTPRKVALSPISSFISWRCPRDAKLKR